MSKDDVIEAEGKIVEALPNATFKVQLSNGHIITAYISGKLHPYHRRRHRKAGNEPVRSDQRQDHLAQ